MWTTSTNSGTAKKSKLMNRQESKLMRSSEQAKNKFVLWPAMHDSSGPAQVLLLGLALRVLQKKRHAGWHDRCRLWRCAHHVIDTISVEERAVGGLEIHDVRPHA